MFTHLFLDTTTIAHVVDTVKQIGYTINPNANMDNIDSIFKNLVAIVAIAMPFIFTLVVVFIVFYYQFKKDKLKAEERIRMIEKGITPPSVVEKKYPILFNHNGKPIATWIKILLGFGAGLFLGMLLERLGFNDNASYWSMITVCVGVMLIFGDAILNHRKTPSETLTSHKIEEPKEPKSIPSKKENK